MNLFKIPFQQVKTEAVILNGGLNESAVNIELRAGELIYCKNYLQAPNDRSGYTSIKGYEVFDGQTKPSDISISVDVDGVIDDSDREDQRALITEVPTDTETSSPVSGVCVYDNNVFSFRDYNSTTARMYKATASGWSVVSGTTLAKGGSFKHIAYTFSYFPVANPNNKALFFVDGVSDCHAYDGISFTLINSSLPNSDLPSGAYPVKVCAWKNRLILVYPDGHVFLSGVGDPLNFDGTNGAGEIFIGDDITDIITGTGGTLIFFTQNSTKILYDESTDAFAFRLDEFSSNSGAIENTAQQMLNTTVFSDDYGITTLEAVSSFGDFSAKSISNKVSKTYNANKNNIQCSYVDRENNRYIVFYTNTIGLSEAIVLTFKDKYLKGVSLLSFPHTVYCITDGKDSNNNQIIFFGSTDGYVYQLDSGTSFNGISINTELRTSYYHYKSPRFWKYFTRVMFELESPSGVIFNVRETYDYASRLFPLSDYKEPAILGQGAAWGDGVWGSFTYGSVLVDRPSLNIQGYGTNMSLAVSTEEKYKEQHTVYNFITDFTIGSRRV